MQIISKIRVCRFSAFLTNQVALRETCSYLRLIHVPLAHLCVRSAFQHASSISSSCGGVKASASYFWKASFSCTSLLWASFFSIKMLFASHGCRIYPPLSFLFRQLRTISTTTIVSESIPARSGRADWRMIRYC